MEIRRSCWIRDHLDVHVAQKLGTRAFRAAQRVLFGQARRVRFKGRNQMDTVEGKSNEAGIRWRDSYVVWRGLVLPAIIDPEDPVVRHALSCRVKYVRLVRRKPWGGSGRWLGKLFISIPVALRRRYGLKKGDKLVLALCRDTLCWPLKVD